VRHWFDLNSGLRGPGYYLKWDVRGAEILVVGTYVEQVERGAKWMQHRDFPGGHPSQYYSGPKALNFRVLMGSGVVALV
jgi:hypothetical protein